MSGPRCLRPSVPAPGRACGNFEATGPTMVPVRQGDLIEVLETHPTGGARRISENMMVQQ